MNGPEACMHPFKLIESVKQLLGKNWISRYTGRHPFLTGVRHLAGSLR
jgi:hypothetical protein